MPIPHIGLNMSGLEFAGGAIPGTLGSNFFNSVQATYDHFHEQGSNVVRIPFTWERIQPTLYGDLDADHLAIVQAEVAKATLSNSKSLLDLHNYGRYKVRSGGGFTSNFSSSDENWAGGSIAGGVLSVPAFQRAYGGSILNPVSPANSYKITTNIKITANGGSDVWRAAWIEFYRVDDDNKYFFTINNLDSKWELFKRVGGVETNLASGALTVNVGTFYTIVLDVNQATPGKINLTIDGVQKANVNSDAGLTAGQVAFFGNGVDLAADNFTLDVDGDTSSAISDTGIFPVGSTQVPVSALADLWSKLATEFMGDSNVLGYDIMNECHDMPVPTTPSNYSSTATVTVMSQAVVDAIRATGDTKYIFVGLDSWSGAQSFVSQYGSDPEPFINDPEDKIVYAPHYYFDDDHSGSYPIAYKESNTTNIATDVTPILAWARTRELKLAFTEFGVTKDAEVEWYQVTLPTFIGLLNSYDDVVFCWTYFAGGDFATFSISIQPEDNDYSQPAPQIPYLFPRSTANPKFVTRSGSKFYWNGSRFRFIGFNAYTILVNTMIVSTMRTLFDACKRHGVTVLRTWCFDVGKLPTNSPGNFRYLQPGSTGSNLVSNPSFETNNSGWGLESDFTRTSEDAIDGTFSIKQVSTGGFRNFTTLNDAVGIPVTPNKNYTFTMRYKLAITSGFGPLVRVRKTNAFGTQLVSSSALLGTSGAWSTLTLSFSSGSESKVWIAVNNNGGTLTAYYDNFSISEVVAPSLQWREQSLIQLDLALDEARKRGVKLILSLGDNNQGSGYDTKTTYIRWANSLYNAGIPLTNTNTTTPNIGFYTNQYTRQLYKDFIYGLVNRTNTINGREYKTDDTIFSWELMNEARVDAYEPNAGSINSQNMSALSRPGGWADIMSTYIKSIDPNHLVGFGGTEHDYRYAADGSHSDWVRNSTFTGVDYTSIIQLPNIDYLDPHCYPTQGLGESDIHTYGVGLGYTYANRAEGYRAQLRDYISVSKAADKPFIIGEVGLDRGVTPSNTKVPNSDFRLYPRHDFFYEHFDTVFDNDGDGVLIWSATIKGGGTFSVGLDETGPESVHYWGSNQNANDSQLMHRINQLNTTLISSGDRPRAV